MYITNALLKPTIKTKIAVILARYNKRLCRSRLSEKNEQKISREGHARFENMWQLCFLYINTTNLGRCFLLPFLVYLAIISSDLHRKDITF